MAAKQIPVSLQILLSLCLAVCSGHSAEPLSQAIDRLIVGKQEAAMAGLSSDAEFLRRVTLDFTGQIPDTGKVRSFCDDASPGKRSRLIDELLADDSFAEHWADRLSVMFLERQDLGKISREDWRKYLVNNLKGSPKWDAMVQEMIVASGEGEARPAMKFLGEGKHDRLTEDIARLLLGMDLKCARCHDHPSVDDWKQEHYWGLFAYLNQTKQATHSGTKQVHFVEGVAKGEVEFQSVFFEDKQSTGPRLPGGKAVEIPQFEKGQEFDKPAADGLPAVPKFRPRELLARDLISPDNKFFVRNSVNRIWFLMMGRGMIHPLDQMHGENPPSHPALLDCLERKFVAHEFDLKWMLREIALSETYQRSSRLPEGTDSVHPASFRVALSRGLTPEQLLDATLRATGNFESVKSKAPIAGAEKFDRRGYFSGTNPNLPEIYQEIRAIFIQTFGQPAGFAEMDFLPGTNQSLFLMNDRLILHWLKPRDGNLVDRLREVKRSEKIAEEMYLSVLSRFPDGEERKEVSEYLQRNETRRESALGDLVWALLTSTEFRLNH